MSIHDIITFLDAQLFKKEETNFKRATLEIVNKNAVLNKKAPDGFIYMGQHYTNLAPGLGKGQRGGLDMSLWEPMDILIKDWEQVSLDRSRIRQALALVLQHTGNWQDVRDAIHNGLAELMDDTRPLARTREEAYTIKDQPTMYNNYIRLRPKIEYYLAMRLLS